MDEEQAEAVEQAFDLDYDVAQAFCSHTVLKALLLFTVEALDDGIDFETEYGLGEGEGNKYNQRGEKKGVGGTGSPFLASEKTTGE